MNINIFKNLHTNVCKPIGSEITLIAEVVAACSNERSWFDFSNSLLWISKHIVKPTTTTLNLT